MTEEEEWEKSTKELDITAPKFSEHEQSNEISLKMAYFTGFGLIVLLITAYSIFIANSLDFLIAMLIMYGIFAILPGVLLVQVILDFGGFQSSMLKYGRPSSYLEVLLWVGLASIIIPIVTWAIGKGFLKVIVRVVRMARDRGVGN